MSIGISSSKLKEIVLITIRTIMKKIILPNEDGSLSGALLETTSQGEGLYMGVGVRIGVANS